MTKLALALLLTLSAAAAAAAELPERIRQRGVLIGSMMPNYPPLDMIDTQTGELTGFDVDLMKAVAERLKIKFEWQQVAFEQMVSALNTGRTDLAFSMTDLPSRHETSTFLDYLQTGPQIFTQASRAAEFGDDFSKLCGKSVGASRVTNYPKQIEMLSERVCAGKEPIKAVGTQGSVDARAQLKQGRIDAAMQGNETLIWIMKQEPNTFALIGKPISKQLTGILTRKDDAQLQQAMADTINALIADGTYGKLLEKWSLADNGVEKVTINAGQ
jgi:polar amino acid transport system substrate-binding protein